ncbi:MAG: VOC family protein [Isosphaeraceae bacterium]|nr:VOC family protein [Isosphaeraceae bacterium]
MNKLLKSCVVIFVKELERLVRFYGETCGMTRVHGDESHVVLDAGGLEVVIHAISPHVAAMIEISDPPEIREENPIKICFPVSSIEAARATAEALGGRIGPREKEWAGPGYRACDGYDPEGNVFQVREATG